MIDVSAIDSVVKQFKSVCEFADLDKEDHTYYFLIVFITVKFIVGQPMAKHRVSISEDFHTVNATACEFLELILKNSKAEV